jgi:hypothetical protein
VTLRFLLEKDGEGCACDTSGWGSNCTSYMRPDDRGDWVSMDDYKALCERVAKIADTYPMSAGTRYALRRAIAGDATPDTSSALHNDG